MYCCNCGKEINENTNFCPNCGSSNYLVDREEKMSEAHISNIGKCIKSINITTKKHNNSTPVYNN